MAELLGRYHREGGLKSDVLSLEYIRDWFNEKEIANVKGLRELRDKIAEDFPEPTALTVKSLNEKLYAKKSNMERALAYEKIFWQNPECGLERKVLSNYLMAGAFKSAKRFYKQIREIVPLDVGFSNTIGPEIWTLGFLEEDEELMETALKDSDTGSYIAMMTEVWHHAAHEDFKRMEKQLDELIRRYESQKGPKSTGRILKDFVPLIPALKDPKHRDHEKALDYLGKEDYGSVLRCILILKYKLSVEEAIRLLGGRETDRFRRVVVLYLLQDAQHLREAYNDYGNNASGAQLVLATWMETKLLNVPLGAEEKDLKPLGAKSIREAVLEKLAKQ